MKKKSLCYRSQRYHNYKKKETNKKTNTSNLDPFFSTAAKVILKGIQNLTRYTNFPSRVSLTCAQFFKGSLR